jgi:hypothetical protein
MRWYDCPFDGFQMMIKISSEIEPATNVPNQSSDRPIAPEPSATEGALTESSTRAGINGPGEAAEGRPESPARNKEPHIIGCENGATFSFFSLVEASDKEPHRLQFPCRRPCSAISDSHRII